MIYKNKMLLSMEDFNFLVDSLINLLALTEDSSTSASDLNKIKGLLIKVLDKAFYDLHQSKYGISAFFDYDPVQFEENIGGFIISLVSYYLVNNEIIKNINQS